MIQPASPVRTSARSLRRAGDRAELDLLAAIRARAAVAKVRGGLRLGIGDDCAILRLRAGQEIIVTTDLSLEQVHFRRDWHPAEAVGYRCLARGLSDLAAMGAQPQAAFLSLSIPAGLTRRKGRAPSWMDRFLDGFFRLAELHGVPLAGGDLAEAPIPRGGAALVAADIVLLGSAAPGRALLRSGARAGDTIYVTGSLGGAAAELLALERSPGRFRLIHHNQEHPHLFPQPRLAVGRRLAGARLASAAIDLSDGLSTDLGHLCSESGVAAEIDATAVPVHVMAELAVSAGWAPSAMALALHGGEDYELLFTAGAKTRVPAKIGGVPIHAIGRMIRRRRGSPQITLRSGRKREPLEPCGWQHFQSK